MKKLIYIIFILFFVVNTTYANPPFDLPSQSDLNKFRSAILTTEKGDAFIELYPKEAPWHVANLKYLADKGFYDNIRVHIFLENYLAQLGAPDISNLAGGPNYTIPPEFNQRKHVIGSLSMVRRPDYLDFSHSRNSHGSQFRILLSDSSHMDGQFVVFGKVVKGMNVIKKLRKGDLIKSLKVYVRE